MSKHDNNNGSIMQGKFIALNNEGKKFRFNIKTEDNIEFERKKIDVSISDDADGFTYITFKNKKYPVEIISKNQNKYEVLINNVSYTFSIETPISFRRKKFLQKQQSENTVEQLLAPMPGKIVDVMIEDGAEVKEGDPVLILEAMKMQNEITANKSGTIKSINVKPGENVNKDDVLLELDK